MGNTLSAEAPRRSQRLYKPHLSIEPPETGLPETGVDPTSRHGRSSISYLVGSVPISPTNSSPTDSEGPGVGIPIAAGDIRHSLSPTIRRSTYRDSQRLSTTSRTWSFLSEQSDRRSSLVATDSRPNSLVVDGCSSLTRSASLLAPGNRRSGNYDVRNYEAQRLMILDRAISCEPPVVAPEGHSPVRSVTENPWRDPVQLQPASRPVTRKNSDASLYMPVRRRSIVQTPGVATRAHSNIPAPSKKSSFHSTHTESTNETRYDSFQSGQADYLSVPTEMYGTEPLVRVLTPCEAEYKQLGGMKFGTLRIVNGSPCRSPAPESDTEDKPEMKSPRDTSDQPSFDGITPCSTMVASVSGEEEHQESTQKPIFKTQNLFDKPLTANIDVDSQEIKPSSENEHGQEYLTAEVLHVRDDPNAKPTAERIRLELESKTLKNLNRSDSGFISSPSSEGSRKALSKADSGYSSNVSLRSLRSFKSAVTDMSRRSPERNPRDRRPQSANLENCHLNAPTPIDFHHPASTGRPDFSRPPPRTNVDQRPATSGGDVPERNSSYRSLASLARGSRIRMPSFRSNSKSNSETKQPPKRSRSTPPRSRNQDQSVDNSRPSTAVAPPPSHPHGVQDSRVPRLAAGSQRRGPPKVRDNRVGDRNVPLNPVYNVHIGAGSTGNLPISYLQQGLRDERSKDTLRTILSVGSTDVLQNAIGRQSNSNIPEVPKVPSKEILKENPKATPREPPRELPREAHKEPPKETSKKAPEHSKVDRPAAPTRRRGSFRAATQSIAQAAVALFPKSSASKAPKETEKNDSSHKNEPVEVVKVQGGNRSVPVDRTATRPSLNRPEPRPQKQPQQSQQTQQVQQVRQTRQTQQMQQTRQTQQMQQTQQARQARMVSPDPKQHETQQTLQIPPSPTPSYARKAKSPPPVSMRTRSVRIPRAKVPDSPRSPSTSEFSTARRRPVQQNFHRENVHSYPPAQNQIAFYGMSLTGVVAMDPQQVASFQGYQMMPLQMGPNTHHQVMHVTQSGSPRRNSMPSQHGQVNPTWNRSRSMVTTPQPHHGQLRPQMQNPEGVNYTRQPPRQQLPQPLIHSIDAMQAASRNSQQTSNRGHGHHRRSSSQSSSYGQNPPFRVLHSYNSPAYRGVPIWG